MATQQSNPVLANFDSRHITIASGAAIFHVKSARVVLCYHTRDKYYFLPKGRRDANENSGAAAEREGFEESGYPNRLLPLPIDHRQPLPHAVADAIAQVPEQALLSTEPVWTQLVPLSARKQYLLFWYICETLPPEDERAFLEANAAPSGPGSSAAGYQPPAPFSVDLTLKERVEMEPEGWQPTRVEGTGVDEEESWYVAGLHEVPRAMELLGRGLSVEIVRKGWELIERRRDREGARKVGDEGTS